MKRKTETVREAVLAVRPGLRAMAERLVNGEESFLETLMRCGSLTRAEAIHVLHVYRKNRVLTERGGEIKVKHGAFLDKVILRKAARHP